MEWLKYKHELDYGQFITKSTNFGNFYERNYYGNPIISASSLTVRLKSLWHQSYINLHMNPIDYLVVIFLWTGVLFFLLAS